MRCCVVNCKYENVESKQKWFFFLSSNQIDANEVLIPPSIEARRSAADVTEENDASVQQQQQQHTTASTPPIFILPEQQQDSVVDKQPDLLPATTTTTTDETTVQNLENVNNRQQHLDTANVNSDDVAEPTNLASNSG